MKVQICNARTKGLYKVPRYRSNRNSPEPANQYEICNHLQEKDKVYRSLNLKDATNPHSMH